MKKLTVVEEVPGTQQEVSTVNCDSRLQFQDVANWLTDNGALWWNDKGLEISYVL